MLGHSFGGATVRMFSELLAHGDEEERCAAGTDELSPLFAGGMEKRIHSIVTLSSPMNGTTAYDLFEDPGFDPAAVKVPRWSTGLAKMMSLGTSPKQDGRDPKDYTNWDMHLDRAGEINERITTLPDVYYFSVPCSATEKQPDVTFRPNRDVEPMLVMRASLIGAYTGKTAGGMTVDESWRESDGLVNTISAMAPSGAPSKPLDREHIEPGLWNVFPTLRGDHMWVQGGLLRRHDIRPFYLDLLTMISSLPE
jgi:triacylglycerol lipase